MQDSASRDVEDSATEDLAKKGEYSSIAQKMMARMGYQKGKGLGKKNQGRVDIVEASNQRGRRGLGLQLKGLEASNAKWKDEEEVMVRQDPDWIPTLKADLRIPSVEQLHEWTLMRQRKETIDDEDDYCTPNILSEVLENKNVFDSLGKKEFLNARTRANPYETIRGAMFMNRAAMKMAEIDASFEFMFTDPKSPEGKPILGNTDILYFADICAGPGGFSEYVLWRKKWRSKGFGFTLRAEGMNDFKIEDFISGTPETFDCHYGEKGYNGDGDIFKEINLTEFQKYVMANSDNKGVHFVMADGGFSVEGQENIQEILSKQLYLCQFTCALSILRVGGHFLCKVFDLFTPFSVGLVYLLYLAFDQICIFKPVTSRPANSERYVVCKGKIAGAEAIHEYMFDLNIKMNNLKSSDIDIREIVSAEVIERDEGFYNYIITSNNTIGARQILGLRKLATFVKNTRLEGPSQKEVRKQCLQAWNIPDVVRAAHQKNNPEPQFYDLFEPDDPSMWMMSKMTVLNNSNLKQLQSVNDFKCCLASGERLYIFGLGRTFVFWWNPATHSEPTWKKFEKVNLELPRHTVLDVEVVEEYKGEGRGQMKKQAFHIIDAIYIGGEYMGDKPMGQRLQLIDVLVKALSKNCRNDVPRVRLKQMFALNQVDDLLNRLSSKQMKGRSEPKLCMSLDEDKYFAVNGLHFIRKVKHPWTLQYSRTTGRMYFFNTRTNQSSFEPSSDSVANAEYCYKSRLMWVWGEGFGVKLEPTNPDHVSKTSLLSIIAPSNTKKEP